MTHASHTVLLVLLGLIPLRVHPQVAEVHIATREWSVGEWQNGGFLALMGMDCGENGSVVVSDKLNHALLSIGGTGNVFSGRQKKGSSPGSFNGPGIVAVGDGFLAVADFASNRVQLLTAALEPIGEIRTPGVVFALCIDRRGQVWVGAFGGPASESLFSYDRDGNELLRLRTQSPGEGIFGALFHLAGKDTLWLAYATRNVVERWDLDGHPLGMTTVSGFPMRSRSDGEAKSGASSVQAPPEIFFVACAEVGPGSLALLAGDVASQPRQEVFTINPRGEIVGLFTLPERSSLIRFPDSHHVVAVEQRKTVLSCYRLTRTREE